MRNLEVSGITVGVVGLGLMGTSFIASLLIAGHEVIAIAPLAQDMAVAPDRIYNHLVQSEKSGLLIKPTDHYLSSLIISEDFGLLSSCQLVVECVIEDLQVKKSVYEKIEPIVSEDTIIATNTSAIPISVLQALLETSERFLGIHWAEPSYFTRFMEITCGAKTDVKYTDWVYELALKWGKEPTLLRKDIRGFVTNRLMYAVYREGFSLVSAGEATLEDVDKAFRYDAGSWITLMGIFRRMDFMGLKDYREIFKEVFPTLCNDGNVPTLMQQIVAKKAMGIQNLSGLYDYSEEESRNWEEAFALFSMDIFKLSAAYPMGRVKSEGTDNELTKETKGK